LRPQRQGLSRFFQVSSHLHEVGGVDKKLLPVGGVIPQLIGSAGALSGEVRLSHIAVQTPQIRICHRELGVDLGGPFEKGQSGGGTS
jgi:hypothetical protein